MITGTIAVVFFIAAYCCGQSGQWGGCVIGIVIGLFSLLSGIVIREDTNAYSNMIDYWSMSGKDRAKARHRWEQEARAEEAEERRKTLEKWQKRNDRKVEREIKRIRDQNRRAENSHKDTEKKQLPKCPRCQNEVFELSRTMSPSGTKYIYCQCTMCGERKLLKAG